DGAQIHYAVAAFDSAGTSGLADQISIGIKAEVPEQKGVLKATARFGYDEVPGLDSAADWKPLKDFLRLTLEEEAEPEENPRPGDIPKIAEPELNYKLLIRPERTVAVGVFGADALSQARAEPPVPARDEKPGVDDTQITLLRADEKKPIKNSIKVVR